jgi:hypothetical protein
LRSSAAATATSSTAAIVLARRSSHRRAGECSHRPLAPDDQHHERGQQRSSGTSEQPCYDVDHRHPGLRGRVLRAGRVAEDERSREAVVSVAPIAPV